MGNSYYNGIRETFAMAQKEGYTYMALLVTVPNSATPEVIITHKDNFFDKSFYYSKAYDKDLTLKANDRIMIIGYTPANSFDDIEAILI